MPRTTMICHRWREGQRISQDGAGKTILARGGCSVVPDLPGLGIWGLGFGVWGSGVWGLGFGHQRAPWKVLICRDILDLDVGAHHRPQRVPQLQHLCILAIHLRWAAHELRLAFPASPPPSSTHASSSHRAEGWRGRTFRANFGILSKISSRFCCRLRGRQTRVPSVHTHLTGTIPSAPISRRHHRRVWCGGCMIRGSAMWLGPSSRHGRYAQSMVLFLAAQKLASRPPSTRMSVREPGSRYFSWLGPGDKDANLASVTGERGS